MNKKILAFGFIGAFLTANGAIAVSAGTTANDSARAAVYTNSAGASTNGTRG